VRIGGDGIVQVIFIFDIIDDNVEIRAGDSTILEVHDVVLVTIGSFSNISVVWSDFFEIRETGLGVHFDGFEFVIRDSKDHDVRLLDLFFIGIKESVSMEDELKLEIGEFVGGRRLGNMVLVNILFTSVQETKVHLSIN